MGLQSTEEEVGFDLDCAKETFMEAKKNFAKVSASGIQDKMQEISASAEVDSSVLTMFWETCVKLLRDSNVVEGLQELINKCANKEKAPDKHRVVRKIGKHKA